MPTDTSEHGLERLICIALTVLRHQVESAGLTCAIGKASYYEKQT